MDMVPELVSTAEALTGLPVGRSWTLGGGEKEVRVVRMDSLG